jgi:hypothetical protein
MKENNMIATNIQIDLFSSVIEVIAAVLAFNFSVLLFEKEGLSVACVAEMAIAGFLITGATVNIYDAHETYYCCYS